MREIIIDTETTGLNYKLGDRVIELACLELFNHIPTGKTLQFYCFTNKQIDESAVKIHGLTNDFLKKHQEFKEHATQFIDFIANDDLVIHNAEFDVGFINNELKICGYDTIKNKVTDTVQLSRKTLKTRSASLDFLCRKFSIDLSERKLHGALLDCQLLAEVYLELKGGKQRSFGLLEKRNNEKSAKKNTNPTKKILPNIVETKDHEIKAHKESMRNLKNSLWNKMNY